MTPGEYTLTYTVADAAGNVATITRVVTVTEQFDTTSPTIEGANNMSIVVGSEFDPLLGVRAVDTVDGDITMNIRVIGDVDTMTPGEYTLTYTVADAAGNVATITRVVTVTEESNTTTVIKPPVNNSTSGGQQQSLLPKTGDETVFHVLMVAVACITLGMFGIKPTKKVKKNESIVEEQSSV
ncbi:MAG: immunoglobulin-like domain-containing protein, partial [Culicoidibacterales bacterium]